MSQTLEITRVVPRNVSEPPEPLRHLVCVCMRERERNGLKEYAWCGVAVGGPWLRASSVKPINLCILCKDAEESKARCKFCGRLA